MVKKREIFFLLVLFVLLFVVYYPSLTNNFTNLDDQVQVVNNSAITGLGYDNLKQIFSSTSVGMYQPVTTVLYAIVYQFSGLNSSGYHLASILFHSLNCLLLFFFLRAYVKSNRILFFLLAVFALHPMQVESVAWVSAFSNLVSATFYLLSLIIYVEYRKSENRKRYLLSMFFFILACLSKSSAVTLPVILLLIDLYEEGEIGKIKWLNKLPFFLFSIVIGIVTINARESAGHLSDLSLQFEGFDRIFLLAYSILFYPFKFLLPVHLSAFYPYPELVDNHLPCYYYMALLAVLGFAYLIFKKREKKMLWLGFLFFLITISVVIQLIPVGNQLTADRYIYLPMIGLLICIGAFLSLYKNKAWLYALFVIPLFFGFQARERSKIWKNDRLIWEDVIRNHPNVAQAYNNLGSYILKTNQFDQALIYFNKAIQLKPYYADAYSNRGNLLARKGDSEAAIKDYNQAIELRPHADAYFNRGNEFSKQDNFNAALADYTKSIALLPSADALTNRAFTYLKQGRKELAKLDLKQSIKNYPKYDRAYFLLGILFKEEGKQAKACENFQLANQLGNKQALAIYRQYCLNK